MSIVSTISAERDRYAQYFETIAADMQSKAICARELLISINNDLLTYPYRYVRADLIAEAADGSDQVYEVWLDPPHDGKARGFQLGPVVIEIYPFTWCGAQIVFDRSLPDLGKLEALLTRWLDVDDAKTSHSGAASAIHSVSAIESNGQFWYFTIDFGTAPADAMLDVIDFLSNDAKVGKIIITSHPRE